MHTSPFISVIMPVYNAELYIEAAIRSILSQTYTQFEFLIFNDGSTDRSLEIINRYAAKDKRIRVFNSTANKGYLVHLNEGLKEAKGQLIARMDADDISVHDRFEKQVKLLLEENVDIVGSNVIYFGNTKTFFSRGSNQVLHHSEALIKIIFSCPIFHPTVMFKRKIVDNGDYYYDENYYPAEDYELWCRLLPKYSFKNIKRPLVYYRQSEGQISNHKRDVQREHTHEVKCRYITSITGAELNEKEKSVLRDFFYHSNHPKVHIDVNILFSALTRILDGLKTTESKVLFCKFLLHDASFLSSKRNKYYTQYIIHGFNKYYRGGLFNVLNGKIRETFKILEGS